MTPILTGKDLINFTFLILNLQAVPPVVIGLDKIESPDQRLTNRDLTAHLHSIFWIHYRMISPGTLTKEAHQLRSQLARFLLISHGVLLLVFAADSIGEV